MVGVATAAPCSADVIQAGRQSFAGYLRLALVFVGGGGGGLNAAGGLISVFRSF